MTDYTNVGNLLYKSLHDLNVELNAIRQKKRDAFEALVSATLGEVRVLEDMEVYQSAHRELFDGENMELYREHYDNTYGGVVSLARTDYMNRSITRTLDLNVSTLDQTVIDPTEDK